MASLFSLNRAYESMKGSEVLYNQILSDFDLGLDSTATQLQVASQHLDQFITSCQEILINNGALKQEALDAASTINATYIAASIALENSRQVYHLALFLIQHCS